MSRRSFVKRGFVKRGFVKRLMPAVVAAAIAVGAPTANAVQFQGVYVFGDSLSDSGYYRPFLLSIGVPASTAPPLVVSPPTLGLFGLRSSPSTTAGIQTHRTPAAASLPKAVHVLQRPRPQRLRAAPNVP